MGRFMADLIQSLAPVDINTRERKQRERLLPFQTLEFSILPFSKHSNYELRLFQNIGILNFAFF